jgi:hypothetical protein
VTEWDLPDGLSDEEQLADRTVSADRRRRLRHSAWIVGGLLTVAVAVALPVLTARGNRPASAATAPAAPASALIGGTGSHFSDQAAIYAAALRHHSAPDTPTEVLVHDHVCATVISKPGSQCLDSAIPMSVRREVAQLLPFPVRFVAQRWGPRTGRATSLIVFGTLTINGGAAATLGVETLCGPMCGEGETLVLARSATGWRVTGTTGPAWIT